MRWFALREPNAREASKSTEATYITDLNCLGHSVIELLINVGAFRFVEACSIAKVVNRKSTAK